jgi:Na+/melibiose symporter-like transporter
MENSKFDVGKTYLLGFGFLGISIIWALYNAYVPVFLKETFHLESSVIGFIMTIDNIFAILLLPYLGALSDKTHTKLGRRRPYILVGAPLAAIFFVLIPFANIYQSLGLMMLTIILMNLSMALFRSPVIALMPDITPSQYRSQANGIINFMGGLGALIVYFGGKPLYDKSISLPFIVGGIIMFIASLMVVIFIREPEIEDYEEDEKVSFSKSFASLVENIKDVVKGEKSLFFILLSILFWFVGYNAIETFFTSYAKYYIGIKASTGALILGFFALTFMLTSLIAGNIGVKLGRNKTIRIGLVIVAAIMVLSLFFHGLAILITLFVVGGIGWAFVNVNSLPMVVDMTTLEKVGGYTGLYYFFSQAANIIAPPLSGIFIDLFGYGSLMLFSSSFFILSIITMLFVKRGEVVEKNPS